MNIAIVDDEPKTRVGLEKLLSAQAGFSVCGVFENPLEALAFLRDNPADVLITDVRMPQLSGLELIRALRQTLPDLKIVILSGYREFSYAQQAIAMGVSHYLTKPTNPTELLEVLHGLQAPEKSDGKDGPQISNLTVKAALSYIEQHYASRITLGDMAAALYVTPQYLCRLFKKHTAQNLSEYLTEYRMERAKQHLMDPRCKISEVASLVGFNDPGYFSSTFKRLYGVTPLEYRNGITEADQSSTGTATEKNLPLL
ncbi:MAG: response regulator [Oscillospiraceae bacterium]